MVCHLKCYGVRAVYRRAKWPCWTDPRPVIYMVLLGGVMGCFTGASPPGEEGPSLDNQSFRIKPGTRGGTPATRSLSHLFKSPQRSGFGSTWLLAATVNLKTKLVIA